MESTNLATAYSGVLNFLSGMVSDSLLAIALSLVPIVLLQVSGHIDYVWLTEYTKALIARLQKILDESASKRDLVGVFGSNEEPKSPKEEIEHFKKKYDDQESKIAEVTKILKDIYDDLMILRNIDDSGLDEIDKKSKQDLIAKLQGILDEFYLPYPGKSLRTGLVILSICSFMSLFSSCHMLTVQKAVVCMEMKNLVGLEAYTGSSEKASTDTGSSKKASADTSEWLNKIFSRDEDDCGASQVASLKGEDIIKQFLDLRKQQEEIIIQLNSSVLLGRSLIVGLLSAATLLGISLQMFRKQ